MCIALNLDKLGNLIIMIERGIENLQKEESQQTDLETVLQYLTQPLHINTMYMISNLVKLGNLIIMIERGIESQAKLQKEENQQTDLETVLQYDNYHQLDHSFFIESHIAGTYQLARLRPTEQQVGQQKILLLPTSQQGIHTFAISGSQSINIPFA